MRRGLNDLCLLPAIAVLSVATILCQSEHDSGWSRFRGPNGSGKVNVRDLPSSLSPADAKRWQVTLPPGNSSPAVFSGRVFLTASHRQDLITYAISADRGNILWARSVPAKHRSPVMPPNGAASATPAVDASGVYVFFQDFGLLAYEHAGKPLWNVPLGPFQNPYGLAASPILAGDAVVLVIDQRRDSYLLAVDKKTGEVLWKTARPEAAEGFSTPVIYRPTGDTPQILVAGSFLLEAYSLANGARLWWVKGLGWQIKTVPLLEDDRVFVSGWGSSQTGPVERKTIASFAEILGRHDRDGNRLLSLEESPDDEVRGWFAGLDKDGDGLLSDREWSFYQGVLSDNGGLLAIRAGGKGDRTQENILWRYTQTVGEIPSLILIDKRLYMLQDGGIVTVFDPDTGQILGRHRLSGAVDEYFASPVWGDSKLYFVSRQGKVTVVSLEEDFSLLSSHDLMEETYATPALTEGRIYIRTVAHLYCFGQPTDAGASRDKN